MSNQATPDLDNLSEAQRQAASIGNDQQAAADMFSQKFSEAGSAAPPKAPPQNTPESPQPDMSVINALMEGIPEKFRRDSLEDSIKAMNESYSQLEKKQSQPKPAEETDDLIPQPKEGEEKPETPVAPDWALVNKALSGQASEEEINSLAESGTIPADLIERVTAVMGMEHQLKLTKAYARFGGQEQFEQVVAAAKEKLSPEEQAQLNSLWNSKNYEFALDGLAARVNVQDNPKSNHRGPVEPTTATPSTAGTVQPYQNADQVQIGIQQYMQETNPAKQRELQRTHMARLEAAQKAGFIQG